MLTNARLAIYIFFVVMLGLWSGAGIHDSLSLHSGWYADPVRFVRTVNPPPGYVNPWPYTTGLLIAATLATLAAFARFRGDGRRDVLLVLALTIVIILSTMVYFVPTVVRLDSPETMTDADIISASHLWIETNAVRMVTLVVLLAWSLVALKRMAGNREEREAGERQSAASGI